MQPRTLRIGAVLGLTVWAVMVVLFVSGFVVGRARCPPDIHGPSQTHVALTRAREQGW